MNEQSRDTLRSRETHGKGLGVFTGRVGKTGPEGLQVVRKLPPV